RRIGNKTAFALSIITNDEDRIIIGADGGITFNDGVEITRFVDDVAANPDNDSVPTSLAIIDYVADQIVPAGGVTSIAAGNGMNFTTITTTGSVIMGTPTTLTASTTNAVTATSHTHSITTGIANTNILRVDHASPTDNDFAKFTANGIEGRSYAEVRADLDLEAGIDFYSKTAEDTWRNSVT
ncbi:MAG: hypothetical protein GY849_14615, partial [Deltaproteobacteria bacterium]|nr:hypothetical protein [Deltaproteobacteria bacterium]